MISYKYITTASARAQLDTLLALAAILVGKDSI